MRSPYLNVGNQPWFFAVGAIVQAIPTGLMLSNDRLLVAKARPADEIADVGVLGIDLAFTHIAGHVNVGPLVVIQLGCPLAAAEGRGILVRLEERAVQVHIAAHHGGVRFFVATANAGSPVGAGVADAGEPVTEVV